MVGCRFHGSCRCPGAKGLVSAAADATAHASSTSLMTPSWGENAADAASFVVECKGEGGADFTPVAASGNCGWFPEGDFPLPLDYRAVPSGGGVPWSGLPVAGERERGQRRVDWHYASGACTVAPGLWHAGAMVAGFSMCSCAALARYLSGADALDLFSPLQVFGCLCSCALSSLCRGRLSAGARMLMPQVMVLVLVLIGFRRLKPTYPCPRCFDIQSI